MIKNSNSKQISLLLFLAFFSALFVNTTVKSQIVVPDITEATYTGFYYEKYKDILPFYFFTYGSGGTLMSEDRIDEDVLKARTYIINFPVLITSVADNPYKIWSQALLSQDTIGAIPSITESQPKTPAMTEEEKMAFEKSMRVLSPQEKEQEKAIAEKEKLYAERIEKGKQLQNTSPTEKDSKSTEKKIEQKAKPVEQKANPIDQIKKDTIKPKIQLPPSAFSQLPDSIKTIVEQKGMEKGLMWLYQQQIVAGNVLFCDADTKMPIAILNTGTQSDFDAYAQVIKFWKNKYQSIWKNSNLKAYEPLRKNQDISTFVNENGKNSVAKNMNFVTQLKAYSKAKSEIK
jgi:hypothetical protein